MTRYPQSVPIARYSAKELRESLIRIIGRSLIAVTYRSGNHSGWPAGFSSFSSGEVDEVDQSVLLDFGYEHEIVLSWAIAGFTEGIDIEIGSAEDFPVPEQDQFETLVSDQRPWQDLCGLGLEGVAAAWQVAGESAVENAWALKLSFADKRRVVIALGEAEGESFRYHPTGLLVFFNELAFTGYQNSVTSQTSPQWQPIV